MCLIANKTRRKFYLFGPYIPVTEKVKEDITVYKVYYQVKPGEYESLVLAMRVKENSVLPKTKITHNKRSAYIVEQGYHSYKYYSDAIKVESESPKYFVLMCIIPKGSIIVRGRINGEVEGYVSNNLTVEGTLEYLKVNGGFDGSLSRINKNYLGRKR